MSLAVFRAGFGVRAMFGLVILVIAACAGARFDGQVYRDKELQFRVGPVPRPWRAIESDDALITFRDDPGAATIAVNGRCGKDGDDVPLQALTHHLFLHFTNRQILSEGDVQLDHRAALHTELIAELDGVPKHFDVYVLKKDGCVYDFLYIADTATAPAGRASFERFVGGFATLETPP